MKLLNKRIGLSQALDGISSWKLWSRHLIGHWPIYFIGTISVLLTNVSEVLLPKFVQWILDDLMLKNPDFGFTIIGLIAVLLIQILGRVGWRQSFGQQTHRVAASMKSILWNRARFFPTRRLESDLSPGELMNVATGDVGMARSTFGFTLVSTFDFLFLVVLTFAAMLSIDVETTLWALVLMPSLPYFLYRIAHKEYREHRIAQQSLSELTDLATQSVATVRLQRLTQTENFWRNKLSCAAEEYRKKRLRVIQTSLSFIPISGIAPLISYGVLLYISIPKTFSGEMSIGAFVAMQSYIFIIQNPMQELGTIISEWQQGFASLDRYTHTLAQPEEPGLRSGGDNVVSTLLVYQVKDLSFRHGPKSSPLFENLNFELRRGDRVGILGPVGSGKSTLLQILSGFEKRFQGSVLLHGRNIGEYSHAALRNTIATVPQKPFLFADTVRSNICLQMKLTDEEIWHYLQLAGVSDDIRNFSTGLDTRLGEWGVNLSGGQKQRLTLARSLARKSEVLLFDDCLSAVDTVTEEKILSNLDRHLSQITLVWVAHRASTLRHCNQTMKLGQQVIQGDLQT